MAAKWVFRELRRGDKDRQPTQGEFFSTDAIRSAAQALVRESIQNSLDASLKVPGAPVRVRFRLSTGPDALPAATARQYFADGWKHFTAPDNGLDDVPQSRDDCPFLVVEDFGTTGLVGDITSSGMTLRRRTRFITSSARKADPGRAKKTAGAGASANMFSHRPAAFMPSSL